MPVHTTTPDSPRAYRTIDDSGIVEFSEGEYVGVREVIDSLKMLRKNGHLLYDSDEYMEDVYRFIVGQPVEWRRRNNGVCDSPNLYFAISPNGNLKVCCDFETKNPYPTYHEQFPDWYQSGAIHNAVYPIAQSCDGCMYGSYPEISISM